jgi:hypothetical protein
MILVAAGLDSDDILVSAELYDPASRSWTVTGSLNTARFDQTATLLQNGMVVVAGGFDSDDLAIASAEMYEPASATWSAIESLNSPRGSHTATLLQNGIDFVAGGLDANGRVLARTELGRSQR